MQLTNDCNIVDKTIYKLIICRMYTTISFRFVNNRCIYLLNALFIFTKDVQKVTRLDVSLLLMLRRLFTNRKHSKLLFYYYILLLHLIKTQKFLNNVLCLHCLYSVSKQLLRYWGFCFSLILFSLVALFNEFGAVVRLFVTKHYSI